MDKIFECGCIITSDGYHHLCDAKLKVLIEVA